MSNSLGPIHFKMYAKIGKQEELTRAIAEYAESRGWIPDAEKYTREQPPLEDVIDAGNIHGWIQGRIDDAETRFAELVGAITAEDAGRIEEILGVAFEFGKKCGLAGADTAPDVYIRLANFFVNGMPCDKINYAVAENEDLVNWQLVRDIHAQYWGGDASLFYRIRKCVIDGMLEGAEFVCDRTDDLHYVVRRRSVEN